MRFLLDTSVSVAAMVESHPAHAKALPWLQRAKEGVDEALVAAHSLAELYAVLTSLPLRVRISPQVARELIKRNVQQVCRVVALEEQDYASVLERLVDLSITGGAVYDALILQAALKADAEQIVTLNARDFLRLSPGLGDRIRMP